MNRYRLLLLLPLVFISLGLTAQTSTRQKPTTTTRGTSTTPKDTSSTSRSNSKIGKELDKVDGTISKGTATAENAQKTFDKVKDIFKPKAANEALVVIPGIEFEDANLERLKDAIEDHKDVKDASVEYNEGTATIEVVLKGKAKADFWGDLPQELKSLFKLKSKKDNSILVEYTQAAKKEQVAGTSAHKL